MAKGLEPSEDFKEKMKKHGKMFHNSKDKNKDDKKKMKPSKLFGKKE